MPFPRHYLTRPLSFDPLISICYMIGMVVDTTAKIIAVISLLSPNDDKNSTIVINAAWTDSVKDLADASADKVE